MIAGSPTTYAATIFIRCQGAADDANIATQDVCCSEIIGQAIWDIEIVFTRVRQSLDQILQIDGVGLAYRRAEEVARRFQTVLGFLEDMNCEALLGSTSLIAAHKKGKLLYQNAA
jgi:hypothetical protein